MLEVSVMEEGEKEERRPGSLEGRTCVLRE